MRKFTEAQEEEMRQEFFSNRKRMEVFGLRATSNPPDWRYESSQPGAEEVFQRYMRFERSYEVKGVGLGVTEKDISGIGLVDAEKPAREVGEKASKAGDGQGVHGTIDAFTADILLSARDRFNADTNIRAACGVHTNNREDATYQEALRNNAWAEVAAQRGEKTQFSSEEFCARQAAVKRFAASSDTRRCFGVHTANENDPQYQDGLKRFIRAELRWGKETTASL